MLAGKSGVFYMKTQVTSSPRTQKPIKRMRCGMGCLSTRPSGLVYAVAKSKDAAESGSGPPSVTNEVRPSVMANPCSLSIRIM